MRYLLDTNAISEASRKPNGRIARRIQRVKDENLGISPIVMGEIKFGLEKASRPELTARMQSTLKVISVIPWNSKIAHHYGQICAHLSATGSMIGNNDMWIAAHALSLRLTLITHNTKEFERVPKLKVEDWSVA